LRRNPLYVLDLIVITVSLGLETVFRVFSMPEQDRDHPRSPEITRDHPRSPEITRDHLRVFSTRTPEPDLALETPRGAPVSPGREDEGCHPFALPHYNARVEPSTSQDQLTHS